MNDETSRYRITEKVKRTNRYCCKSKVLPASINSRCLITWLGGYAIGYLHFAGGGLDIGAYNIVDLFVY